nr:immunoglobulin heavy chain junction region [Mus musculus]
CARRGKTIYYGSSYDYW